MMEDKRPAPHVWRRWVGPLCTALLLVFVEVVTHGPLRLPEPLPAGLFLMSLGGIVLSAFLGGLRSALVAIAIYTLYGARFIVPPGSDAWLDTSPSGMAKVLVVLGIALAVGLPTAYLKRRDERLHARVVEAERSRAAAIEQSRRELKEKNEELESLNRALTSVNEGLEAFSYVVSHDLKEPVRAMTAYLEEAEERAQAPEVREAVRAARLSNDRLARLLAGLLEVARASRVEPHALQPIYVGEALESDACSSRYKEAHRERGARIELLCLTGTPPVRATEEHVCQILGNLVLNAIRHNDKTAPLVRVRIAPQDAEGRMVEICVEDDGLGFDPRIVDRLGTIQPGRPATVKGGFGLIIVRRAVERLGGTLWITRSVDLGGAAVHFTLPSATSLEHVTGEREMKRNVLVP